MVVGFVGTLIFCVGAGVVVTANMAILRRMGRATEGSLVGLLLTATFNWKHRLEMGVNLLGMRK